VPLDGPFTPSPPLLTKPVICCALSSTSHPLSDIRTVKSSWKGPGAAICPKQKLRCSERLLQELCHEMPGKT